MSSAIPPLLGMVLCMYEQMSRLNQVKEQMEEEEDVDNKMVVLCKTQQPCYSKSMTSMSSHNPTMGGDDLQENNYDDYFHDCDDDDDDNVEEEEEGEDNNDDDDDDVIEKS
jgi:hypothetical protein